MNQSTLARSALVAVGHASHKIATAIVKGIRICIVLACGFWAVAMPCAHTEHYMFTTLTGSPGNSGTADGSNSQAR